MLKIRWSFDVERILNILFGLVWKTGAGALFGLIGGVFFGALLGGVVGPWGYVGEIYNDPEAEVLFLGLDLIKGEIDGLYVTSLIIGVILGGAGGAVFGALVGGITAGLGALISGAMDELPSITKDGPLWKQILGEIGGCLLGRFGAVLTGGLVGIFVGDYLLELSIAEPGPFGFFGVDYQGIKHDKVLGYLLGFIISLFAWKAQPISERLVSLLIGTVLFSRLFFSGFDFIEMAFSAALGLALFELLGRVLLHVPMARKLWVVVALCGLIGAGIDGMLLFGFIGWVLLLRKPKAPLIADDAQVQIARSGKVLGTYAWAEIKSGMNEQFTPDDSIWWQGAQGWRPLRGLVPRKARKKRRVFEVLAMPVPAAKLPDVVWTHLKWGLGIGAKAGMVFGCFLGILGGIPTDEVVFSAVMCNMAGPLIVATGGGLLGIVVGLGSGAGFLKHPLFPVLIGGFIGALIGFLGEATYQSMGGAMVADFAAPFDSTLFRGMVAVMVGLMVGAILGQRRRLWQKTPALLTKY